MSFTEWYKVNYKEDWHEDFAHLYDHASEASDKYEEWCKETDLVPVWNG